ncbi:G-protein-signaling modulator 3 [Sceloporus undulatus]|uniref:G-protein-signaling modulator 3 n=1 Tax=Sceloporus undulatus TaxID=8520 RepID=UPI001C4DC9AB|nr:G-protein-signaling modulator 3 [Sceloporus undulatus]
MENKMDTTEEEEMLPCDGPTVRTRGEWTHPLSQDDVSFLPNQGALLRPRQRIRQHDPARPWNSLPATPVGELETDTTVFFSSLTSLQAEEFFDMVAKVQAKRLNDQRADFAGAEETCAGSSKVAKEQLYDTILAHQSQRLEDQRTEPPIPVGIQGLLDLLMRAQGTRMEDQRSTLPPSLSAPSLQRRQPSFIHGV